MNSKKQGSITDLTSVLLPVAQIAGHNSVESLKPYLAIARKRLLQQTKAARAAVAEDKEVAAKHRLLITLAKLQATKELQGLAKAIKSGDKKKIIDELQKLQALYSP